MLLNVAVIGLSSSLIALVAFQSAYVWLYCRILRRSYANHLADTAKTAEIDSSLVERTAIILCLRGVDPVLNECLLGISRQKPAGWQLHIVFDAPDDPAVEFVKQFLSEDSSAGFASTQPQLHFNTEPPATCSLKCSSIVAVVRQLPESIEYVALIDADTVADDQWLADLLAPFSDPSVGATTGNRWFTARPPGGAAEVRRTWNAAAIVQVLLYNIAWGGSLAFRRSAIRQCGFLERWRHAFCEDTMVADVLAKNNLRLQRVPHLIMNNTEQTDYRGCFGWIVRQLLTVRLYHKRWPMVLMHGLLTATIVFVSPVLVIACLIAGNWSQATMLAGAFLIYQILNIVLLAWICKCNQQIVLARGKESEDAASTHPRVTEKSFDARSWTTMLKASVINQAMYPFAVWKAWTTRSTDWRGVSYALTGGGKIAMQTYVPYREIAGSRDITSSIQ